VGTLRIAGDADVAGSSTDCETALLQASQSGNVGALRLLFDAGAPLEDGDKKG
jgi:hypothetical protein